MIIIAGYELVDAEHRDAHVAAFADLVSACAPVRRVRPRRHHCRFGQSEQVNTVEVWQDADALNKWRRRAKAPRTRKPNRVAVRRYDAADTGGLF